jgi:hypothetical protein
VQRKSIAEGEDVPCSIKSRRLELHEDEPLVVAQCVLCDDLARGFVIRQMGLFLFATSMVTRLGFEARVRRADEEYR